MNFSQKTVLALLLTVSSSSQLFCPPVESKASMADVLMSLLTIQGEIDTLKQNSAGVKALAKELAEATKANTPISDEKLKEADAYLLAELSSIVNVALPTAQLVGVLPTALMPANVKEHAAKIAEFAKQLETVKELIQRIKEVREKSAVGA